MHSSRYHRNDDDPISYGMVVKASLWYSLVKLTARWLRGSLGDMTLVHLV